MNIQDWFPLGWTGWISLQSKGLSRVFSISHKMNLSLHPLVSLQSLCRGLNRVQSCTLSRWPQQCMTCKAVTLKTAPIVRTVGRRQSPKTGQGWGAQFQSKSTRVSSSQWPLPHQVLVRPCWWLNLVNLKIITTHFSCFRELNWRMRAVIARWDLKSPLIMCTTVIMLTTRCKIDSKKLL